MYAVRKGRTKGIFESWDECQESVKGFKGAEFRKFGTVTECKEYLNGSNAPSGCYYGVKYSDGSTDIFDNWDVCKSVVVGKSGVKYKKFKTYEECEAWLRGDLDVSVGVTYTIDRPTYFTDGSYKNGAIGCGFVLVDNGKVNKFCCRCTGKSRNLSGELASVMLSIKHAMEMGFSSIQIIADNDGVQSFAEGTWSASSPDCVDYCNFLDKVSINIKFVTVKSHSGDQYNTMADKLSKAGTVSEDILEWKNIISLDGYIG